jgi:hypothetical protein
MQRREFLALGGFGIAGLAGCLGSTGANTDDPTATPTPTDTATPTDTDPTDTSTPTETETPTDTTTVAGADLSVTVERVQPAVVELATPDSIDAFSDAETQYLYLWIEVTNGAPPARDDLTFRLGGNSHGLRPAEQTFGLWRAYHHDDERYDAERGSGWVLFELPEVEDASDAALRWPGGEWQPGSSLRERLSSPAPTLSVEWSVPDTVSVGDQPTIEFTVTNESDRPGRFVAGLNRTGGGIAYMPVAAIHKLIPAGETVSWSVTDTYDIRAPGEEGIGDGEPDMTYKLARTDDRLEQAVRIVDG